MHSLTLYTHCSHTALTITSLPTPSSGSAPRASPPSPSPWSHTHSQHMHSPCTHCTHTALTIIPSFCVSFEVCSITKYFHNALTLHSQLRVVPFTSAPISFEVCFMSVLSSCCVHGARQGVCTRFPLLVSVLSVGVCLLQQLSSRYELGYTAALQNAPHCKHILQLTPQHTRQN